MTQQQLDMLNAWLASMAGSSFAMPSPQELVAIADAGTVPDDASPIVRSWEPTLTTLLKQATFGVRWGSFTLGSELSRPRVDGGLELPAGGPTTAAATRLERLRAWRSTAEGEGRVVAGTVTEGHLGTLSKTPPRSAAEIGKRVRVLEPFAAEVFDVLHEDDADADPDVSGTARPSPASGTTRPSSAAPQDPTVVHSPPPARAAGSVEEGPLDPPTTRQVATDRPEDDPGLLSGYAEATSAAPDSARALVTVKPGGDGVAYHWPPAEVSAPVVVYRIVTGAGTRPYAPEVGRLVAATTGTVAVDPADVETLLQYVQVWVNAGASVDEAKADQPVLHAETVRVAGVRDVVLSSEHGQVTAQWGSPDGAHSVHVHRLPHPDVPPHELHHYRIAADQPNLGGFVDSQVTPGQTYVYRLVVAGAGRMSEPVDVSTVIPDVLAPVRDLTCTVLQHPTTTTPGQVDLEWTRPGSGQVQIHRSDKGPGAGVVGVESAEGALPQMGLTEETLRRNPIDPPDADGRVRMRQVQWPPGMTKVYFLPVTVLNGRAVVGPAVSSLGVAPPGDPRILDRLGEQIVTFTWPPGAGGVRAFLGPVGADGRQVCQGPAHVEVSRRDYERQGGLRLRLPAERPMAVFLVSVVQGEVMSDPICVVHSRHLVVRYSVEQVRRLRIAGPVVHLRVTAWSDGDVNGSPPFVVVFNDKRLPLHADDGEVLGCVPDDAPDASPVRAYQPPTLKGGPTSPRWRAIVGGRSSGYARMFVSPTLEVGVRRQIALIDPPVSTLRWSL